MKKLKAGQWVKCVKCDIFNFLKTGKWYKMTIVKSLISRYYVHIDNKLSLNFHPNIFDYFFDT